MDTRTKEAVRYLGYGKHAIDEPTLKLIQESFEEIERIENVKFIYRIFELTHLDAENIRINHLNIESRNLANNLKHCQKAILLAVTLGTEVDRALKKYEVMDIAKAAVFQACAAAYLEEHCDKLQEKFAEKYVYLRPRYSPGYGDFSIFHQKDLLEMLEAQKRIGLTMTENYMLTPTKSVTAIIGISQVEVTCHKYGCESCEKADCLYRRS